MGLTKFGGQIIAWNSDILKFTQRTKPAIIKVVGPFGHNTEYLKTAKRMSPNSKWLFRLYVNEQPLDNPSVNARTFSELMKPYAEYYDIFEGYNEPPPHSVDDWKRINEFDSRLANIINLEWGKKYCAFNWSNGQPPNEAWEYLRDALNRTDYIGLHNYGWKTLPDCPQFALRHREIFNLLPVKKLMILSEVGMTDAVFGGPDADDLGWKSWIMPIALFAKEGRAAAAWAWFLDRINEDPYIVGANAYTTGRLKGDGWGTHDFTPRLYKLLGDYILGHPSPDPYLPNGGNNMETDSPLVTWRKGVPLGNYSLTSREKIKIVLHSTDGSFTAAVNHFLNPDSRVSAHYVIGRGHAGEPKIYQMVREDRTAHHAGDWGTNVYSIGIECADDKLNYLTESQGQRLIALLKDIVKRHPDIGRSDIILHRDVVPTKCPQAISEADRANIVAAVFVESPPAPDWEAKYKELKNTVTREIEYLDKASEEIYSSRIDMIQSIAQLKKAIIE